MNLTPITACLLRFWFCIIPIMLIALIYGIIGMFKGFKNFNKELETQSKNSDFTGLNNTEKVFSFSKEGITVKTLSGDG